MFVVAALLTKEIFVDNMIYDELLRSPFQSWAVMPSLVSRGACWLLLCYLLSISFTDPVQIYKKIVFSCSSHSYSRI